MSERHRQTCPPETYSMFRAKKKKRRRRRRGKKYPNKQKHRRKKIHGGFGSSVFLGDLTDFIAPSQACVNPICRFLGDHLRLHRHQHLHLHLRICVCACVRGIVGTGTHFHCERRIFRDSGRAGWGSSCKSHQNDADKNCDGLVERLSRMQWMRDKCRDCSHYLAEYECCARGTGLWQF